MICKFCRSRYAPYPLEDYFFKKNGISGIYQKSDESHERRIAIFRNDEEGSCGCDEYELMRYHIIQRRQF